MDKVNNMSLAVLLRDEPSMARRIERLSHEVKKDSLKMREFSETYNEKYKREIQEGTAKKHLLLEDGRRKGQTDEEIEKSIGSSSGFIPTVYTPILNWLYFFILEGRDIEMELLREEQEQEYSTLEHTEKLNTEKVPDVTEYIYGNMTMERFQTLKKLKRLSKSPNKNEAFSAYTKCLELCDRYGVEFDKIPS